MCLPEDVCIIYRKMYLQEDVFTGRCIYQKVWLTEGVFNGICVQRKMCLLGKCVYQKMCLPEDVITGRCVYPKMCGKGMLQDISAKALLIKGDRRDYLVDCCKPLLPYIFNKQIKDDIQFCATVNM